ncbi:hypothetical protein EVAR_102391_1 [Eumeta japonica]|uniref:Uncharacterized protein n=1 Tax=Eumeta variegata TaxID=151549 RepID=A0A4C1YPS9_EUMVA|nr:hypothetical protein EVAR_102391_1 [Eumeta japonica]
MPFSELCIPQWKCTISRCRTYLWESSRIETATALARGPTFSDPLRIAVTRYKWRRVRAAGHAATHLSLLALDGAATIRESRARRQGPHVHRLSSSRNRRSRSVTLESLHDGPGLGGAGSALLRHEASGFDPRLTRLRFDGHLEKRCSVIGPSSVSASLRTPDIRPPPTAVSSASAPPRALVTSSSSLSDSGKLTSGERAGGLFAQNVGAGAAFLNGTASAGTSSVPSSARGRPRRVCAPPVRVLCGNAFVFATDCRHRHSARAQSTLTSLPIRLPIVAELHYKFLPKETPPDNTTRIDTDGVPSHSQAESAHFRLELNTLPNADVGRPVNTTGALRYGKHRRIGCEFR